MFPLFRHLINTDFYLLTPSLCCSLEEEELLLLHQQIWPLLVRRLFPHSVLLQRGLVSVSSDSTCEESPVFPLTEATCWSRLIISFSPRTHSSKPFIQRSVHVSAMLCRVACWFLFCVLWGPVLGGPTTNLHPNITDQQLFWGSDQYDFSVVLRAAGMECFWHFAHRGERFYLSFMVR